MVQLGGNFLCAVAAVAAGWLLLRFVVEPTLIRGIRKAASERVAGLGAGLAASRTARNCLVAALAAFAIAVAAALVLGIYINILGKEAGSAAVEVHSRLVAVRDIIERGLDLAAATSQGVWVLALCILALIWVAVSYSGSKRRWSDAFEARRRAVWTATETLGPEELDTELAKYDEAALAALAKDVEALGKGNRDRIAQIRGREILALAEESEGFASIDDLARLRNEILKDAEGKPTPEAKEASEAAASTLSDIIAEAERRIGIPLLNLDGGEREYPLAEAGKHCQADPTEVLDRKRRALVAAKMQAHQSEGGELKGREPELLSEWFGAAATGGATVRGVSALGRLGSFVAIVAFFLSLLGVSANALGPGLVLRAEAYEIDFVDAEATIAIASAKPPVEPPDTTELASDEATTKYIRTSFRVAFATDLRQSLGVNSAVERAAFQIGAADTRRAILASAARNAAPSAEIGSTASRQAFVATRSADIVAVSDAERYLDAAIDRRIQQMRQHETLWASFRREALTPASPNQAAEALLRTALGDGAFPSEHSFRIAADRSAGRFAYEASRLGSVAKARAGASVVIDTPTLLMTARDQRLVADFRRAAPTHVEDVAVRFRSGDLDPGSLHRVPMGLARGAREIPPATVRAASSNVYAELFPALADGAADFGSALADGANGRPHTAVPRATSAARSFTRIRFSGRVGGVVIGREPDPGGDALNVVGFDWRRVTEDAYILTLSIADGRRVNLGPYHPALIFGALAYAADGRVVTSTLPQPTGERVDVDGIALSARRVLVHPALEDTSVACPAIQIDRFVDSFTGSTSTSEAAIRFGDARLGVTLFGELLSVLGSIPSDERYSQQEAIRDWVDARDDYIRSYASQCAAADGTCFPMAYYEKFNLSFGNSNEILQCIARGGQCLEQVISLQTDYGYLVDSGVREQGFVLDKDFKFLTGSAAGDTLWPLDFIVQAVPQGNSQEQPDVDADLEPWTFPMFADDIRALVRAGIGSDRGASLVFEDMKDFVVLQRLFRLSLSGWLGFDFPVQRLVELEAATRPATEIRRHERWNMNESIGQILIAQADALAADLAVLKTDAMASAKCRATVDDALTAHEMSPWPQGAGLWPVVGAAGTACQGTAAGRDIENRLQRMRDLDLVDDAIFHVQGRPALSCDPL